MVRFWDTSALIPVALDAPASGAVRGLLTSDSRTVVWWVTPVECASAVARLRRDGAIDAAGEAHASRVLERLLALSDEVHASASVRGQAIRLVRVHSLRAADALQLGAALAWATGSPVGRELVSLDERLRDAARREGFAVLPGPSARG